MKYDWNHLKKGK